MSTSVVLQEFQATVQPSAASPLDEAVWKEWLAKGHAREQRNSARRFKVVKLVSIVVLLTTAAFWSCLAPFDIVVRFIVAVGAVVVMLQTLHARNYASAAALALLYQPGRTRIQFCRRLAALCNGCKRHTLPHFTRVAR